MQRKLENDRHAVVSQLKEGLAAVHAQLEQSEAENAAMRGNPLIQHGGQHGVDVVQGGGVSGSARDAKSGLASEFDGDELLGTIGTNPLSRLASSADCGDAAGGAAGVLDSMDKALLADVRFNRAAAAAGSQDEISEEELDLRQHSDSEKDGQPCPRLFDRRQAVNGLAGSADREVGVGSVSSPEEKNSSLKEKNSSLEEKNSSLKEKNSSLEENSRLREDLFALREQMGAEDAKHRRVVDELESSWRGRQEVAAAAFEKRLRDGLSVCRGEALLSLQGKNHPFLLLLLSSLFALNSNSPSWHHYKLLKRLHWEGRGGQRQRRREMRQQGGWRARLRLRKRKRQPWLSVRLIWRRSTLPPQPRQTSAS
jgi:hypothetical protein